MKNFSTTISIFVAFAEQLYVSNVLIFKTMPLGLVTVMRKSRSQKRALSGRQTRVAFMHIVVNLNRFQADDNECQTDRQTQDNIYLLPHLGELTLGKTNYLACPDCFFWREGREGERQYTRQFLRGRGEAATSHKIREKCI